MTRQHFCAANSPRLIRGGKITSDVLQLILYAYALNVDPNHGQKNGTLIPLNIQITWAQTKFYRHFCSPVSTVRIFCSLYTLSSSSQHGVLTPNVQDIISCAEIYLLSFVFQISQHLRTSTSHHIWRKLGKWQWCPQWTTSSTTNIAKYNTFRDFENLDLIYYY